MLETKFISTHKLDFLVASWDNPFNIGNYLQFKIGTCVGAWRSSKDSYEILAVVNECAGNGHFLDVMEWFENSCRRDKKSLIIAEVWNKRFGLHLVEKRGFSRLKKDDFIKHFK